jgi:hypothetical protein
VLASLKGCAAEVEVAAGGLCEDEEVPCRGAVWVAVLGEMGVALRGEVVERERAGARGRMEGARARRRRQRRQSMVAVVSIAVMVSSVDDSIKRWDGRENVVPSRASEAI